MPRVFAQSRCSGAAALAGARGPQRQAGPSRVAARAATLVEKGTSKPPSPDSSTSKESYLAGRIDDVSRVFPGVLSMDDFLMRTEMALSAHNFRGDNSIAMSNVCRDEATGYFKSRIDKIFGPSFNMNGLGACLTCGRLGVKAGLSHAPNESGREKYVFFSFPHIAIAPRGKIGGVSRPGREAESTACGALLATLGAFQNDPKMLENFKEGEHEPTDIELTILMQRLAARISQEGQDISKMDLVALTNLAERAITDDLEHMIADTVDTSKMDYAVVTGVQVHNWADEDSEEPSFEFIVPRKFYVVNDGERTEINVSAVPALSPRQLALLQNRTMRHGSAQVAALPSTTVIGLEQPFSPAVQYPDFG